MRIWTMHPKYLDSKGLVALWREGLLAKAVLEGNTKGYINHPQLIRFKNTTDPLLYINFYLHKVHSESLKRNYNFNISKLHSIPSDLPKINEWQGQLDYEWKHLISKLKNRDFNKYKKNSVISKPQPHPIFNIVNGGIRQWEKYSN